MLKSPCHRAGSKLGRCLAAICNDESGGEVIEWALVAGLISITVIAILASMGTKVVARWTSINSSM